MRHESSDLSFSLQLNSKITTHNTELNLHGSSFSLNMPMFCLKKLLEKLQRYAPTKGEGERAEREEIEEREERDEREEKKGKRSKVMEHHGTSWNIMEHHGTSWNIMEHHGTS